MLPPSPTLRFGKISSVGYGDTCRVAGDIAGFDANDVMSQVASYTVAVPIQTGDVVDLSSSTEYIGAVSSMLHGTDILHWNNAAINIQHEYQMHTMMTVVSAQYRDPFLGTFGYSQRCDDDILHDNYGARMHIFGGIVQAIQEQREKTFAHMLSTIDIELEKRNEQHQSTK